MTSRKFRLLKTTKRRELLRLKTMNRNPKHAEIDREQEKARLVEKYWNAIHDAVLDLPTIQPYFKEDGVDQYGERWEQLAGELSEVILIEQGDTREDIKDKVHILLRSWRNKRP